MSDGYVKVYESILQSTIWLETPDTKIVWITMLALKDKEGVVRASIPGLAKTSGVTIEACQAAINCFLSPDPFSRTRDFEGRRIQEVDGGWFLINHAKYRDLRTQKNINDAKRKADSRKNKVTAGHNMSHDVTPCHGVSGDGDGDVFNSSIKNEVLDSKNSSLCDPKKNKSKQPFNPEIPARRQKVIEAFNAVAEQMNWFACEPKPSKATTDLITKFCEDEYRFSKLDELMAKASQSDFEACRIDMWMRTRTFNNIMNGNWLKSRGPERKGVIEPSRMPQEALDLTKPWNRAPEPEKRPTGLWDSPEGII